MFGSNKQTEIIDSTPKIKILGFKNSKAQGDLLIGKGGYVRVSHDLAMALRVKDSDMVLFGQFGSQLLIAKREEGHFGHIVLKELPNKRGGQASFKGQSTELVKEFGQSIYKMEKDIVEDADSGLTWVKLTLI